MGGMASTMIDTLQISHRLREAGAEQRVADAVASVVAEATLGSRDDLSTKQDLALLRKDMETAIIASQNRMLLAVGAMLTAAVGVLLAVLRH